MNILILAASPRKNGNTNSLVKAFCEELDHAKASGAQGTPREASLSYEIVDLYDQEIEPCLACRHCQKDWQHPGCIRQDDLSRHLFDKILQADLIVLATPVYAWFCTAPAKALLDRCVYALNKYYGTPEQDGQGHERGPAIWAGKRMAIIATCGYPQEKGADLLEEGIRRYCKHSSLQYAGMLCERHMGYDVPFMDEDKEANAKAFAQALLKA